MYSVFRIHASLKQKEMYYVDLERLRLGFLL